MSKIGSFRFALYAMLAALVCSTAVAIDSQQLKPRVTPIKPAFSRVSPESDISHVVVKFQDDLGVRLRNGQIVGASGQTMAQAKEVLDEYSDSRLRRLFDAISESRLNSDRAGLQAVTGQSLADLNAYFRIEVTDPGEASQLVDDLNRLEEVEIAYVEPNPSPATFRDTTPDFSGFQDYRESAPDGVDANYANSLPGGDGAGVLIIDIEGNWRMTHEDLASSSGRLFGGDLITAEGWEDHGTAVLGELIGANNGLGITGVSPSADIGLVSIGGSSTAEAVYLALDSLEPGDVLLIELQAPGPHYDFEERPDQHGYICMEFWQANFDAILYAWAHGVTVVQAAGNGREDFDDPGIYGSLFDTTYRNSHSIVVGAGFPAESPNSREREAFSNYGRRINLQGYGSNVHTTGEGDLYNGGDPDRMYTAQFNGTSAAAPIVAGAAACLQGYYKATYGSYLTSDEISSLLVTTGTAQEGDTSEHIGPLPNLLMACNGISSPPDLRVSPILIDTTVPEGNIGYTGIWLHNLSGSVTMEYSIIDNDSLAQKRYVNWLIVSQSTGTINANDSAFVEVILDCTSLDFLMSRLVGALHVSWGVAGEDLDSSAVIPVFLTILCNDHSYQAISSDEPFGPMFSWIAANELGVLVEPAAYSGGESNALDNGTAGPLDLGFLFPYYESHYDQIYVGINGATSFENSDINIGGLYLPLDLPAVGFSTFVAPLWADLLLDTSVSDAGIYTYSSGSGDTTVFQWHHLSNANDLSDSLSDFELIFTVDGKIIFQYESIENSALLATALAGCSETSCRALTIYDGAGAPGNPPHDGLSLLIENSEGVYVRSGNVNGIGGLDVADLTYLVEYLFAGGSAPVTSDEGDLNCSGGTDVSDLTWLVEYLFAGGPIPCHYFSGHI